MISPRDWEASASWMLDLYRLKCPCQDLIHHPSGNIQLLEFFSHGRIGMLKWNDDKFNPPKSLTSSPAIFNRLMLHDVNPGKLYIQNPSPQNIHHSAPSLALKGAPGQNQVATPPKKYIASHAASKHQLNYESSWFYGMVDVLTIDIPMIQHWITSPLHMEFVPHKWNDEMTKWHLHDSIKTHLSSVFKVYSWVSLGSSIYMSMLTWFFARPWGQKSRVPQFSPQVGVNMSQRINQIFWNNIEST